MSAASGAPAIAPVDAQRPRKAWDVVVSVVLLAVATLVALIGGFLSFVSLAFVDYCPPGCSIDGAVNAQLSAMLVAGIVWLVGLIATIVALVIRRRGWWVALLTLVLVIATFAIGWWFYELALTP